MVSVSVSLEKVDQLAERKAAPDALGQRTGLSAGPRYPGVAPARGARLPQYRAAGRRAGARRSTRALKSNFYVD